jgi:hypothetical protein
MSLEEHPELKRIPPAPAKEDWRAPIRMAADGDPTREVRLLVPPHLEGAENHMRSRAGTFATPSRPAVLEASDIGAAARAWRHLAGDSVRGNVAPRTSAEVISLSPPGMPTDLGTGRPVTVSLLAQ